MRVSHDIPMGCLHPRILPACLWPKGLQREMWFWNQRWAGETEASTIIAASWWAECICGPPIPISWNLRVGRRGAGSPHDWWKGGRGVQDARMEMWVSACPSPQAEVSGGWWCFLTVKRRLVQSGTGCGLGTPTHASS